MIQEMVEHYSAKINTVANDIALYREDMQEGAETLVVSYGVTSRAASVAVRQARSNGHKVSSLVLQTLYPVPESHFAPGHAKRTPGRRSGNELGSIPLRRRTAGARGRRCVRRESDGYNAAFAN